MGKIRKVVTKSVNSSKILKHCLDQLKYCILLSNQYIYYIKVLIYIVKCGKLTYEAKCQQLLYVGLTHVRFSLQHFGQYTTYFIQNVIQTCIPSVKVEVLSGHSFAIQTYIFYGLCKGLYAKMSNFLINMQ